MTTLPHSCPVAGCDSTALVIVNDNGETDPSNLRTETYECEYGHENVLILEPREAPA